MSRPEMTQVVGERGGIITITIRTHKMKLFKYLLLGAALVVTQQASAAVIKLGPACNIYNAIKAANTDKRVRGCRAGKGADTIAVSFRKSNPKVPYPPITSNISIKVMQTARQTPPSHWAQGYFYSTPPMQLFTVARKGNLSLDNVVLFSGSVGVAGRFKMSNGWIFGEFEGGPSIDACAITGHPGSVVTLNNMGTSDNRKCGISLNRAKLFANNLTLQSDGAAGSVGIRAVDSSVNLRNSYVAIAEVGIDLVRSNITMRRVSFRYNTQDVRTDSSSAVVAPPAGTAISPPPPVAPPISPPPPEPTELAPVPTPEPEPTPTAPETPSEPTPEPTPEPEPGEEPPNPF